MSTPSAGANLALAVLPHDEENNKERREDGHGCNEDGHVSMVVPLTARRRR